MRGKRLRDHRWQEATGEGLVLALSDAERRVARRLAQVPAHHGGTVERWRALAVPARADSHGMTELAEFTQLPPASVTRLVDGLVADSLAPRKADPRDRRRVLVHIPRRGLALQRQLFERIAAERDTILGKVEDSEVAALVESFGWPVARLR
jgi:DNA-binding MarR family transcriptional regulator